MSKKNSDDSNVIPEMKCKSADCKNNLHCFVQTKNLEKESLTGACRYCHKNLIDWKRLHKQDIKDYKHTFDSLRLEMWRNYFFEIDIDEVALCKARKSGIDKLRISSRKQIARSVGKAEPFHDGYQTKREGSGNIIDYGQHATATCCRKCIEQWHGIPQHRELLENEIIYLAELVVLYILQRLPEMLNENK